MERVRIQRRRVRIQRRRMRIRRWRIRIQRKRVRITNQFLYVTLADIEANQCRWPVERTNSGNNQHLFCGKPIVPGSPYCKKHKKEGTKKGDTRSSYFRDGQYPPSWSS